MVFKKLSSLKALTLSITVAALLQTTTLPDDVNLTLKMTEITQVVSASAQVEQTVDPPMLTPARKELLLMVGHRSHYSNSSHFSLRITNV